MKRFVKICVCALLIFMVVAPVTCFATEIASEGGEMSYHTLFSRLWEFVQDNRGEVVSAGGSLVLLIFGGATEAAKNKRNKKLDQSLEIIQGGTSATTKAQGTIIGAINEMIKSINRMTTGYDQMREAYEKYESVEDDRNRLIGAVLVQQTAILEILSSVYVHNSRLPQGVKDLVVLKYANVQKALSDDEILMAIVASVREKINYEEPIEVTEDVSEDETIESDEEAEV